MKANNFEVIRPGFVVENLALAVSTVVFCIQRSELNVLLTQKNCQASEARWCLPSGGMRQDELLEQASCRTVHEETGIRIKTPCQFETFSDIDQYPEKRVVRVAFYTLTRMPVTTEPDTANWNFFSVANPVELEISQKKILLKALMHLQQAAILQPVGEDLLPDQFTMEELQIVYEAILQRKLDAVRFRRMMWNLNLLIPQHNCENKLRRRSAQILYRFNVGMYRHYMEGGFYLDL